MSWLLAGKQQNQTHYNSKLNYDYDVTICRCMVILGYICKRVYIYRYIYSMYKCIYACVCVCDKS